MPAEHATFARAGFSTPRHNGPTKVRSTGVPEDTVQNRYRKACVECKPDNLDTAVGGIYSLSLAILTHPEHAA